MRSPREMFNQRSSLNTALKAALTQNFQKRIGNGHSTPVACTGTACCNYANSHVPLESHHDKSNCARYNEITRIQQRWWCAKSCFSGRNLNCPACLAIGVESPILCIFFWLLLSRVFCYLFGGELGTQAEHKLLFQKVWKLGSRILVWRVRDYLLNLKVITWNIVNKSSTI